MWKKLFGPKTPEDYAERTGEALDRGDDEAALRLAQELVAKFPASAQAWLTQANVLSEIGRRDEALKAYERAAQVDSALADAWLGWATALADGGDHLQALEKYAQAIKLDPKQPIAFFNHGNSLVRLRRYEEALASYQQSMALGGQMARATIRSTLLKLGRLREANQSRAGEDDPLGEARERRRAVAGRNLVARYFTGQHSNPELLDSVVESMLDTIAPLEHKPPGLANGVRVQYGWSALTVWDDGSDLVLCDPDWDDRSAEGGQPLVSFSAMLLVQQRIIHNLTQAPGDDCSCHDTILVENGALEADRVIMCRVAPSAGGDSGWHVRCTVDEEFSGHHVPMTALVSLRPHLLKVVTLPKGWNVHVDGTEIVRILDTERNTRFPPPDGGAG